MKSIICLAALLGAALLSYALFSPLFDSVLGWDNVPDKLLNQQFEGIEDPLFGPQIENGKKVIDSIHRATNAPSISVATMIDGRIIWNYAVGYQNIEKQVPADTSTLYRIGSVSKALTSLGLGRLMQEEKIHLDSSIQYYTNHFLDKPRITLRQLASHQSGIRNYASCLCFPVWEYYRNKQFNSVEESLTDFEADELLFPPGTSFEYSSFNFTALSLAMKKASSKSFLPLMETRVFTPLGMQHTMADFTHEDDGNKAIPYQMDRAYFKRAPAVNLSNKWAGGGFLSTPSDLVRAGNALLDSVYLSKQIIEQLVTPQRLADGTTNPQNYALGWRHSYSSSYFDGTKEVEVIHHGGMAVGGLALLISYPEYNMVMAITINRTGVQGNFELFEYITPIADTFFEIH